MKTKLFKRILGGIWFLLFLSGMVWSLFFLMEHGIEASAHKLQNFASAQAGLSVLFLWGLFVVRSIFYLPSFVLLLAGGFLFGPFWGAIVGLVGEMISASLSFGLARYFGHHFVETHENAFFQKLDLALSKRGFFTILILRVIPIVPFDPVNIGAGLSRISFLDYFWATAIGLIPPLFLYALLGDSLDNPRNILLVIVLMLAIIPLLVWAKRHPHFQHFFLKEKIVTKVKNFREKRRSRKEEKRRRKLLYKNVIKKNS